MKSLSSVLSAVYGRHVQRPGILVEAYFSTVRRWSSQGDVVWPSQTWSAADVSVDGLAVGPFSISGTLTIGNADGEAGALVLMEGVQDKVIRIFGFDADAPDSSDVVWLCNAVGGKCEVTPTTVKVTLRHAMEYVATPRTYVNAAAGFNQLLPAGAILTIGGTQYQLERD